MALLKYFPKINKTEESSVKSPYLLPSVSAKCDQPKKRGPYLKLNSSEKAEIGKYASEHGVTKAAKRFEEKQVKKSSIRDWQRAYESELKEKVASAKPGELVVVESLPCKKRGRPPLLGTKLDEQLQAKILLMRSQQAVINSNIVIGVARALLLKSNKSLLSDFGGPINLEKEWARQLLKRMGFSKRRATSTSKVTPSNLDELRKNYLINIYSVVKMEEIPDSLVINWDQTGMKIVPTSAWTMERKGTKRVEIAAADDKRQITGVFACSLEGNFLPIQLIFQGTTPRCLPKTVQFPKGWHLTCSQNHWSNESTMVDYIKYIIVPYVTEKRKSLGLSPTYPALAIFDYFKGQCQPSIFELLEENNIFYVLVPANCTDRLQPLDLSVNKPAKDYMKRKFQEWYATIILKQLEDGINEPVDMRLALMKPLVSTWAIEMFDFFASRPDIIINGFRAAGIFDTLKPSKFSSN